MHECIYLVFVLTGWSPHILRRRISAILRAVDQICEWYDEGTVICIIVAGKSKE